MKRSSLGLLAAGALGIIMLLFLFRPAAPPPFTLTSAAITLPAETEVLPAGPHAELVTSRCTACHSAGMMLNQPPLSAEQWQATVTKMREVYRAPVPVAEDTAIVAYLTSLGARR